MPASDHGHFRAQDVIMGTGTATDSNPKIDHLSPDTALASSPSITDNGSSPLRFLNERARASQASSFRLSKDMANLRWDGSELQEDELQSEFAGADGRDMDEEDQSAVESLDGDPDGDDSNRSREEIEIVTYSTLSKRADFILAHAKRKLNLLEGNLGKARHSLSSPQHTPTLRTTSSLSSYASSPTAGGIDDLAGKVKLSPRINFGVPRHLRSGQTVVKSSSGHSRMFSDTSVPSPGGGAPVKGSRSLDLMQNGDIQGNSLQEEMSPTRHGGILNTVIEDEDVEKGSNIQSLRELYGASSPPPKSTQELRDQAEELRSRIAFLQRRSKDDAARSQYLANNPTAERTEAAFLSQVEALERSLEDQEEVINQLEDAEKTKQDLPDDPRGEWQQVLASNEARKEGEESINDASDDDYDELPDDLPDVLGDEDVDETKSMSAAHEDREDAFDYETFILHSAMGRGVARASSFSGSERSYSDGSEGSIATETGATPYYEDDERQTSSGEEKRRSWDDMHQPNDSVASLTTMRSFETAHEDAGSDADSEASDRPQDDLLRTDLQTPWPIPPQPASAGGQRTMFRDSDIPTPTAAGFPRGTPQLEDRGTQYTSTVRPLSSVFQTLMVPDDELELPRSLDRSDQNLVRACVDSLRSVCLEAIHPSTGPRDMKALRERLEVAKRVLSGEL